MAEDVVLEQLQRLGMTSYEAKAYIALIAAGVPLNGYEVAKRSKVPRSTVYETLGKLVGRGAAFEVNVNASTAYLPLPVESLLTGLEAEFDEAISRLKAALPSVISPPKAQVVHHLNGEEMVLGRATTMIENTTQDLYLALWDEETRKLAPAIQLAEQRQLAVFLLVFGGEEGELPHSFPHRLLTAPDGLEPVSRRLLLVVSDRSSVLIGSAVGDDMWAIYSDDPAVSLVAIEYVRHDIALQQLAARMGVEEVQKIWRTDPELRRLAAQRGLPGSGPARGHRL
jgi:sugar-specific transcriptional regulator TrmB